MSSAERDIAAARGQTGKSPGADAAHEGPRRPSLHMFVNPSPSNSETRMVLAEIFDALGDSPEFDAALRTAMEVLRARLGWGAGHVYVRSETGHFTSAGVWAAGEDDGSSLAPLRECTAKAEDSRGEDPATLLGRVVAAREAACVEDLAELRSVPRARAAREAGFQAAFGFPVLAEGEVVAVLEFFAQRPGRPPDDAWEAARRATRLLGVIAGRERLREAVRSAARHTRSLQTELEQAKSGTEALRTQMREARGEQQEARAKAAEAEEELRIAREEAETARKEADAARADAAKARKEAETARTEAETARTEAGVAREEAGAARTRSEEAEARGAEGEELFELFATVLDQGVWDWDLRSDRVRFSGGWAELVGVGKADLAGRPEDWLDRIHPDDRDGVEKEILEHLRSSGDRLESRHRLRHADGRFMEVIARGRARHDPDGEPARIVGTIEAVESKVADAGEPAGVIGAEDDRPAAPATDAKGAPAAKADAETTDQADEIPVDEPVAETADALADARAEAPADDAEDAADEAPAEDVMDAAPAEDVMDAAPAEDVMDAAPAEEVMDAAPAEDAVDAAPAEDAVKAAAGEGVHASADETADAPADESGDGARDGAKDSGGPPARDTDAPAAGDTSADALAGFADRDMLVQRLDRALVKGKRRKSHPFALLVVRLGQVDADSLLPVLARRFRECISEGDMVAYMGDSEFGIVAHGFGGLSEVIPLARSLEVELRQPIETGGEPVAPEVEIGVALGRPGRSTSDSILADARKAMERARTRELK